MDASKCFMLFACFVYLSRASLTDKLLYELVEEYEENKRTVLDPEFCEHTPYKCYECNECHDNQQYGMCIKDAKETRCLCKWGFTGANAVRVPDVKKGNWSHNRVRADDCKTQCHYTKDYWNPQCVAKCNENSCKEKYGTCVNDVCVPDCDVNKCKQTFGTCVQGKCKPDCDNALCKLKYGKCEQGKCVPTCDEPTCIKDGGKCIKGVCSIRCCKNLLESVTPYSPIKVSHKDYCINRCHYYELKPNVCQPPHITPPCDEKCTKFGGKCDEVTGRCQCCKDFTGPHAKYEGDQITADHCIVWCPYERDDGTRNPLCVNPNWIERAKLNQLKNMKYKIE